MANYLDSHMLDENPIVSGYMFITSDMNTLLPDGRPTRIEDYSDFKRFSANIYAVPEDYKNVTYDQFYIPSEVNGEPGVSRLTGEKVDAHEALYAFED